MTEMGKTIEFEVQPGSHIGSACEEAVGTANRRGRPVHFLFNDTHVTVQPGESPADAEARWQKDCDAAHEAYLASPEYKASCEKRKAEERAKREAHHLAKGTTEKELREEKVPRPVTKEQLTEYVESLVNKTHDYGTCVYAMSMAAEAAYNYVSHCLGVSGFQASCADLDFLRRTRGMERFLIINAGDALYPQSDPQEKFEKYMIDIRPWLKEQAARKLAETDRAHPDVIAHWKMLAGLPHG